MAQLGVVLVQHRRGQHRTLAVGPVARGPQAGGQRCVVVQGHQGGGRLQLRLASIIRDDLAVFQRGALTVRRQKWQPCRAGKFCQRRGPRGRKHLGIKSVDIAFECLQHKTVPSVDLKFFTELLYVPPAAEPAES